MAAGLNRMIIWAKNRKIHYNTSKCNLKEPNPKPEN
jgi:hypothetical protein